MKMWIMVLLFVHGHCVVLIGPIKGPGLYNTDCCFMSGVVVWS